MKYSELFEQGMVAKLIAGIRQQEDTLRQLKEACAKALAMQATEDLAARGIVQGVRVHNFSVRGRDTEGVFKHCLPGDTSSADMRRWLSVVVTVAFKNSKIEDIVLNGRSFANLERA